MAGCRLAGRQGATSSRRGYWHDAARCWWCGRPHPAGRGRRL